MIWRAALAGLFFALAVADVMQDNVIKLLIDMPFAFDWAAAAWRVRNCD